MTIFKSTMTTVFLAAAGASQAAVIDFTTATNDGSTIVTNEATVTLLSGEFLGIGDFVDNAACPVGTGGCNGSMELKFDFDVKNVMFDFGFGNDGDFTIITLFDGIGDLVGAVGLGFTGVEDEINPADLSAYGTIRTIVFDNTSSTGGGYAYGNITYDVANAGPAPVPLPASLPLLLAGLGGLALWQRKRAA
jgi:hypothetical protein